MKIRVTLKDPDRFYESVQEEVDKSVRAADLMEDEQEAIKEIRTEKTWKFLSKWVEYQEYVTLEFDTEAGTATVVCK